MITLFCSLNFLNVSESPTTGLAATAREAIVVKVLLAESLIEDEDAGKGCVSKRLFCRKMVDLKAIAILSVSSLSERGIRNLFALLTSVSLVQAHESD